MPFVRVIYRILFCSLGVKFICILLRKKVEGDNTPTVKTQITEPKEEFKASPYDIVQSIIYVTTLLALVYILAQIKAAAAVFIGASLAIILVFLVLQSITTVGNLVLCPPFGKLSLLESESLFVLAGLLAIIKISGAPGFFLSLIVDDKSGIGTFWLLSIFYMIGISLPVFFSCALIIEPLQRLVRFLIAGDNRVSRLMNSRYEKSSDNIIKHLYPKKIYCVKTWKKGKGKNILLKVWWCLLSVIVCGFDIMRYLLGHSFFFAVIFVGFIGIVLHVVFIVPRMLVRWISNLSEKAAVVFAFRISICVGITSTVVYNRYKPFVDNADTDTAVLEFIASVLLIPLILEWITSYKRPKKEDNCITKTEQV